MDKPTDKERIQALRAELEQREFEITMLRETTQAIGSELDLTTVFHVIAERALLLIDAETVLIPTLNEECNEYTYRAGAGLNADEIVGESLPLEFGVCGWVWRHRKPWWRGVLNELSEEERNRWEKEAGTLILVPLVGRRHFLGGIAGINKRGGGEFTEKDLHILELFAGQAAIAIENAMAMDSVERSMQIAENYQFELEVVNKRLSQVNRELEQLSLYDQLTGLPNRSLFRDRLQRELSLAEKHATKLSVLIVDLDHFQVINETLGHDEGDRLLREVARRFSRVLGPVDTLSRMTADEFAVLLVNGAEERHMQMARTLLACLDEPIELLPHSTTIKATIGIASYPIHGQDATTLLKHADAAMSSAKRDKQSIHVYEELHDERTPGRLAMLRDLKMAIDQDQFELHYQPKVELATGRLVGVEALARWPHKDLGQVPTEMFISAMQQTGMISAFSYWALKEVIKQRAAWRKRGWEMTIALNLPVTVILEEGFVDQLAMLLSSNGGGSGLILEITENIFLADYERLSGLLYQLRDLGLTFSIDDFGTGHSSLSRLRQLPVSELKIDRSFVMDLVNSKDDEVIVKSIIDMSHNLGIQICAEGVETAEILQMLYRWRCDMVQGYHISKALPAEEFETFIDSSCWNVRQHQPGSGESKLT